MIKTRGLLIIGMLCYLTSGVGQEPHFVEHEISEPFVNARVNLLYQDRNCLIWMGTSEGLISYNGFDMRSTPFTDTTGERSVTAMFEDATGRMWIGCDDGSIYQYQEGKGLSPRIFEEGWPVVRITGFQQDPNGWIWFGTYGEGLYCYDGTYMYNFNTDDGMLGDDIYDLTKDLDGNIWAATDGGINICSFDGEHKSIRSITRAHGLPDQIIKSLRRDPSGNMWIGTYDAGICFYDVKADSVYDYHLHPAMSAVNALELFDDLEVWIGTDGSGVWRYNMQTGNLNKIAGEEELEAARVTDLYKDVEGNLWITANANDIYSAFRQFEIIDLACGDIQALHTCATDRLWIGTNQGLYTLEEQGIEGPQIATHAKLMDLNISAIKDDPFGNIWIGTLDQGIFIYNESTQRVLQLEKGNGLINNSIMSFDISHHTLWIATLGGVAEFDLRQNIFDLPARGHAIHQTPYLSSNFIYQVYIDRQGDPWFASNGDGVFTIRDGTLVQFKGNDSLQLRTVYSITQDHRGHFWMSTPKLGLVEFDGQSYRHLGLRDGLSNLEIASLATDHRGDILIVHPDGIDVMKPAERHFMYFDDEIGIEKLDPGLNAICTDRFNALWLGTKNRIIKYPALSESLSIHPRTQLKQVSIFLDPIDFYQENHFKYNQNYISFDYVGLWYTSPKSVKYQYKLDGYDINWKESKDHLASYSNVGPGTYTFMVKASENRFFHDEPIAEYRFTISRPFWAKAWFLAIAALLVGGLFYLFMRFREKRSERQALMTKEKIESQFMALKAQINPHFLFNSFNTLVTIIDESPDIAVEYVEKLSDFYRSILQFREKETISLQEEIEVVRNYWFLLQKRFGNNLRLDVHINGQKSNIPPLTLQMLVENAVKHNIISKSRPLNIEISLDAGNYISVRNNKQKKQGPVSSTHFGLQSIVNRYQLLSDKKVIIEEDDYHFKVSVPVLKKES
ncbi:MAG: two-component regulator propeller domain-containing protein [Saprospiraceae bacterium]|nr:two-component regulator propeller domain-containing protein [Saprospiraceae bacterium]